MLAEIVDWRLAAYLRRQSFARPGHGRIVCRVLQSNRRPILKLPDRARVDVPEGDVKVLIEGDAWFAGFRKHYVNVLTPHGSDQNALPDLMRRWFGPYAGQPGTRFDVVFERRDGVWTLEPMRVPLEA
jgi:hypothetical protein